MMKRFIVAILLACAGSQAARAQSSGAPVDLSINMPTAGVANTVNPAGLRIKGGMCQNQNTVPINYSFTTVTGNLVCVTNFGVYTLPAGAVLTFPPFQNSGILRVCSNTTSSLGIVCTGWQ